MVVISALGEGAGAAERESTLIARDADRVGDAASEKGGASLDGTVERGGEPTQRGSGVSARGLRDVEPFAREAIFSERQHPGWEEIR